MRFNTLSQWLSWQETLHSSEIELGLERVRQVYQRLYSKPFQTPVISVAGTNGKGSSVAMLASIYTAAGYNVGSYTSPHLVNYNERICINREMVDDATICQSFERIDQARQQQPAISLTYFEFGTLAAFDIFHRAEANGELDVILLEVGLGGRLDVVNLVDADVALITSIGLDHTDWLGDSREAIGFEKAGIMRTGKPAVCSDPAMPASIEQHATKIKTSFYCSGREFNFKYEDTEQPGSWQWASNDYIRSALPRPALPGEHQYQNAAGVLMVAELLNKKLPVSQSHIRQGLLNTFVAGRCEIISGDKTVILDVAHNPDSIKSLAQIIQQMVEVKLVQNKTTTVSALVGMMKDKAIQESLALLSKRVTHWYVVSAPLERAASNEQIAAIIKTFQPETVATYEQIPEAFRQMQSATKAGDILLVFGSFHVVGSVLASGITT